MVISDKDINLIFNEFEQGVSHNSGENFGSGLGLSIVKTLVEGMNGEIKVESSLNKGSTFSVFLSLLSSDKIDLVPRKNIKNISHKQSVNKDRKSTRLNSSHVR